MRRALLALSVLLSACGGSGGANCGIGAEKDFVMDLTYDWYLFLDLLPDSVDTAAFPTADDLLDHLTAEARAQNKDRYFSFLTSRASEDSYFDEGEVIGFGVLTLERGEQLFVGRVEPEAPAHDAGFVRGDEILAIGPNPQSLTPVSALNDQPGGVGAAFGPSSVGVTRTFRVRTPGGQVVDRTISKALFVLETVPAALTIPRDGLTPVGFVSFETFIEPAKDRLRAAFADFKAQNVQDVIVDLRYNGGGLVNVAELLANLLAADEAAGATPAVMFETLLNEFHEDESETVRFSPQPQAIAAQRIAFIATEATASASELTINSLEPYAEVAIIGDRTYGKPVGQFGFDMRGCDTVLRLVTFRDVNADGDGDFYDGLPTAAFDGDFCTAEDDLAAERGGAGEDSTAVALAWIGSGACPVSAKAAVRNEYPRPHRASTAQVNMPGFF